MQRVGYASLTNLTCRVSIGANGAMLSIAAEERASGRERRRLTESAEMSTYNLLSQPYPNAPLKNILHLPISSPRYRGKAPL